MDKLGAWLDPLEANLTGTGWSGRWVGVGVRVRVGVGVRARVGGGVDAVHVGVVDACRCDWLTVMLFVVRRRCRKYWRSRRPPPLKALLLTHLPLLHARV